MLGFVRRQSMADGEGLPLEASALVVESGGTRVALCGVDVLGMATARVDRLRERIGAAISADPAGILLNWNHTHCAPPPGNEMLERSGLLSTSGSDAVDAYADLLEERLLEVVATAAERLEPAGIAWGIGAADLSVNRRERDRNGQIVHGWRAEGIVDQQVVALQAQRSDGSAIATVTAYGCHPVAVGMDFPRYSSDYPGALREALRELTGGEVVFLQGCGGNVLPRVSFCTDETEAQLMGRRLAVEALHALADRPAWPTRYIREGDASLIPMILFRREPAPAPEIVVAALEERVSFPLQPAPSVPELAALAEDLEAQVDAARRRDAGAAEVYGLLYHAKWARATWTSLRAAPAPSAIGGPMHAVRIGEGVIVTAPGELFTEIGWAIKERSPAVPTMALGYTNGAIGYFPTVEAYAEGGYEPAYSNRSYGAPCHGRAQGGTAGRAHRRADGRAAVSRAGAVLGSGLGPERRTAGPRPTRPRAPAGRRVRSPADRTGSRLTTTRR